MDHINAVKEPRLKQLNADWLVILGVLSASLHILSPSCAFTIMTDDETAQDENQCLRDIEESENWIQTAKLVLWDSQL